MELTEPIETINARLIDFFGVDTLTGLPIWRVVWSEDQMEKRLGTYTDYTPSGIWLREVTEVREVPKYRQWIQQKFVLERLTLVPEVNQDELPTSKLSYEPLWVFEDRYGRYLPPKFEAAQLVIDTVYAVQYSDHNLSRYKDPENSQEASIELKKQRVDEYIEQLFGDESGLLGTTITGESIIVPRNYKKES